MYFIIYKLILSKLSMMMDSHQFGQIFVKFPMRYLSNRTGWWSGNLWQINRARVAVTHCSRGSEPRLWVVHSNIATRVFFSSVAFLVYIFVYLGFFFFEYPYVRHVCSPDNF